MTWSEEQALVEILRGRLEGLGPVTQTALTAPLGLEPDAATRALIALESRRRDPAGPLHSGRQRRAMVRPPAAGSHPSLHDPAPALGDRSRRGARLPPLPVRLAACERRDAPGGAGRASRRSRRLEGFEAPANAWETEILPARLKEYEPSWLDAHCLAGRSAWARLTPPAGANDRARPGRGGALDADRAHGATGGAALDVAGAPQCRDRPKPARSSRARLPRRAGRLVLRRARRTPRICCVRK